MNKNEKKWGLVKDPDATPRANPKIAALMSTGLAFDKGALAPIGDGRADTELIEITEHPRSAQCEIEFELRRAVLRVVLGYDTRPLAAVAAELGLTRAAASRVHAMIVARLGWANLFSTPERRAKNETAARRRWRKEKARVRVTEPEPAIETGTEKASSNNAAGVNDSASERKAA